MTSRADDVATSPVTLSIVIVNWNTRDLLLRVLGQLLPPRGAPLPCEVLVVDNASGDDSVAAARAAFPAARVLPQQRNGGFAFGVNRGLEVARGRWVLLLNTDTEVTWDALQAFVAEADLHPEAAIFGPRITDEHGAVQTSTWPAHRPAHALPEALFLDRWSVRRVPDNADPIDVECVSGCVFLIRRAALHDIGGLDERFFLYFEEADLCERVRRSGRRILYLPRHTFVHVGGLSANQAAIRTFVAFRESCLLYHAGFHGRLATEWVRACLWLGVSLRLLGWSLLALLRRPHRAHLYLAALRYLSQPLLVGRLCRRPRQIPSLP